MSLPVGFGGAGLDRADRLRSDPDACAAALRDPAARLLRMAGAEPVAGADGRLDWLPLEAHTGAELVLLGLDGDRPRFAAVPDAPGAAYATPATWGLLALLDADEAAIFATARSVTDWHVRHRFCARCGGATMLAKAGWQRSCMACGAEHFPRTDPVVIMLAEHDGPDGRRVLLGRQPRYPAGRYSALAGFVEPGESIERAVARELFEEAGIAASDVRYVASQPWPFPSSLMIACIARAADDALTIDTTELEDAFWATRDEVAAALAGAEGARFMAPPPLAIAHTLLREWVAG